MSSMRLHVVTPERSFFDEAIESIVLQATDGEFGVLPGHQAVLVALIEGVVRIEQNGKKRWFAASSGFATVLPDAVILMLQTAEWPEEIDINRAKRDEEEAREALRQKQSMHEYAMARSMLARAMARLRVTRSGNNY